jgi:hypothetical protein
MFFGAHPLPGLAVAIQIAPVFHRDWLPFQMNQCLRWGPLRRTVVPNPNQSVEVLRERDGWWVGDTRLREGERLAVCKVEAVERAGVGHRKRWGSLERRRDLRQCRHGGACTAIECTAGSRSLFCGGGGGRDSLSVGVDTNGDGRGRSDARSTPVLDPRHQLRELHL